jgi:nucleoid-associated protein YgaU
LIQLAEFPSDIYTEGSSCFENGRVVDAVESFSAALALQPDSAEIHVALARAFARLGHESHALAYFERAIQLAPDRTDIRDDREALARSIKQKAGAVELNRASNRRLRILVRSLPVAALTAGILLVIAVQQIARWNQPQPNWPDLVQQRLDTNPVAGPLHLKVAPSGETIKITGKIPDEAHRQLVLLLAGHDVKPRVDVSPLQLPTQPPPLTYCVRSGDSWWTIAKRQYRVGALWPELEKANPTVTAAPNNLKPGTPVVLPSITIAPAMGRARGN